MEFSEIYEQTERAALHQLVLFDTMTQALRPRLSDPNLPLEEALALTHTLASVSALLLRWAQFLLPGRGAADDEETVCPACAEAEAEESTDD